jgi:hypothetical protein
MSYRSNELGLWKTR